MAEFAELSSRAKAWLHDIIGGAPAKRMRGRMKSKVLSWMDCIPTKASSLSYIDVYTMQFLLNYVISVHKLLGR